jgi:hypothetical protein
VTEELEHPEITRLKWRAAVQSALLRGEDPETGHRIVDDDRRRSVQEMWSARLIEDDDENTPRMIMNHYEGSMTIEQLRAEVKLMLSDLEFEAWEQRWQILAAR